MSDQSGDTRTKGSPPFPIAILMRHGSRDPTGEDRLTSEGRAQALQLTKDVQKKSLIRPQRLISSPRRRTQDTLKFLAEDLMLPIELEPACDERRSGETMADFENRVRNWLGDPAFCQGPSGPEVWLIASHFDWLQAASLFLPSDETDLERNEPWSPIAKRVYFYQDNLWRRKK